MHETITNNSEPKALTRCVECDREVDNYVTFVSPTNETQDICWDCQQRADKGFNTKRDWKRSARQKDIETITEQ